MHGNFSFKKSGIFPIFRRQTARVSTRTPETSTQREGRAGFFTVLFVILSVRKYSVMQYLKRHLHEKVVVVYVIRVCIMPVLRTAKHALIFSYHPLSCHRVGLI
jgi:hypothetical protein